MNAYTQSILNFENDFLKELRQRASRERDNVPILRTDAAALLKMLTVMRKPRRILEAGTAIGYSAILMAEAAQNTVMIDTVEIEEDTAAAARRNIETAGLSNVIRVITGDAGEVFSCLGGPYDMIFLDSAKSHYLDLYDDMKRLLAPGGLLVCDNVIFYGKISDDPENAPHKHRTIITRLRAFLEKLCSDDDFVCSIIEAGDGMALAVKEERIGNDR